MGRIGCHGDQFTTLCVRLDGRAKMRGNSSSKRTLCNRYRGKGLRVELNVYSLVELNTHPVQLSSDLSSPPPQLSYGILGKLSEKDLLINFSRRTFTVLKHIQQHVGTGQSLRTNMIRLCFPIKHLFSNRFTPQRASISNASVIRSHLNWESTYRTVR
jgi:hypothetical protein